MEKSVFLGRFGKTTASGNCPPACIQKWIRGGNIFPPGYKFPSAREEIFVHTWGNFCGFFVRVVVRPQAAGRWRARAASRRWRRAPLAAGSWANRAWACPIKSGRRRRRAGVLKGSPAWASSSRRHSSASVAKGKGFFPWTSFSAGVCSFLPAGGKGACPDWQVSECRSSSWFFSSEI